MARGFDYGSGSYVFGDATWGGLSGGSWGGISGGFGGGGSWGGISGGFGGGGSISVGIASMVLNKNGVPNSGVIGSSLTGYDIKSQDCVNMLKLSLLAEAMGIYPVEVYCGPDGIAKAVKVGQDTAGGLGALLYKSSFKNFEPKVDHVVVRGRQVLPKRYNGGTISLMGKGFALSFDNRLCTYTTNIKSSSLKQEAWAEFERSQQSKETNDLINTKLVRRSKWEQLVGFKATFADIPSHASISLSQTTPREAGIPFGNVLDSSIVVSLGDSSPDGGGLIDISNVQMTGSAILSIEEGSEGYDVLLDHECSILSLTKGQNWFVLPAGPDSVYIRLKNAGSNYKAWETFYGMDSPGTNFYRRRVVDNSGPLITSVAEGFALDQKNADSISAGSSMTFNPPRGTIVPGIGGSNGAEVNSITLSFTIAKPSIQIRSPNGDAFAIAGAIAAGGVMYSSIVLQELPPPVAHNGAIAEPPVPPDLEGVMSDMDNPLETLEGTIIDISAPFLGKDEVAAFSSAILTAVNKEGSYEAYSYAGGGYGILPGMSFGGGVVQTIEFTYADKDSVTTNITTGPVYMPIGSYSDSQYVKRSESITRTAVVVAGDNESGTFVVNIDGYGIYSAILGTIEPVYPGDRCEVKMINVPVEKD